MGGVLCFAVIYFWAFRSSSAAATVWLIWPEGRFEGERLVQPVEARRVNGNTVLGAAKLALHFSLLSAFRIGWRELNVGSWITRLQREGYVYRASGWMRTVSGIQSLLSVYLLALWALTYFGRPFE